MNFKKKWLRLSLRTFLVLVTAFAVWLGWTVHRAKQTKRAIDAVEELGGRIHYVHETKSGGFDPQAKLPGPTWLRELIGSEYFLDVSFISFTDPRITNDDLKQLSTHLKKLQNLQALYLYLCPNLSDISALEGLTNLQMLNLGSCNNLSDITALQRLTNLQKLDLSNDKLSDISPLQGLTNLQMLRLNGCDNLSDITALQGLTNLQTLDLLDAFVLLPHGVAAVGSVGRGGGMRQHAGYTR